MLMPDIEAFEERAAIMQYDGGCSRKQAEDRPAQVQGFRDVAHYWQWLADYVVLIDCPRENPRRPRWSAGDDYFAFFLTDGGAQLAVEVRV